MAHINIVRTLTFVLAFLFVTSCSISGVAKRVADIPMGSVVIKEATFSQRILPNGLTVIFKKRDELPLVSGNLYIAGGYAVGNCGIPGLGGFTLSQMREGGTKNYSPDDLDKFLDDNAASLETSQGEDFSSLSFSGLSQDFSKIIEIFSEAVLSPRFDEKRLLLSKHLMVDEISRRKDDADTIASLAFSFVTYGKGSIWYDPVTTQSLSKINQSAVRDYYKGAISPKGAYLIVSGNIDEEDFFTKVEKLFSGWADAPSGCLVKPQTTELKTVPSNDNRSTIYLVNRDFAQSAINIGHVGHKLTDLDVYKMSLFNRAFGSGSFDSLLFKEIRDKRGLAYGVSGGISATKNRGAFIVSLATKSNTVPEALSAVNSVLKDVLTNGFSKDSIEGAVRASNQAFVFKFEDPVFAVSRPALIKLSGLPADYDQRFQEETTALKNSNLKDFSNEIISLNKVIGVVVGKITGLELLEKLDSSLYRVCELNFTEVPSFNKCY